MIRPLDTRLNPVMVAALHVDRQPAPEDRIHILAAWLDRGEEQPRKD